MKEKLSNVIDIIFEALIFYVFFVMCVFSVELEFLY
jgi:hypothetical protein